MPRRKINGEDQRKRWVRRTRESVARALEAERIPMSAGYIEGNLDITSYVGGGFGFRDQRTEREISHALRWLVEEGYAERVDERDPEDPPGVLYAITLTGIKYASETDKDN